MTDILHQLTIQASPAEVYAALTEQDGLAAWWTRGVRAEPREGSTAEFSFEGGGTVFKMVVEELKPDERVVWAAVESPVPGWPGTHVTFDLSKADNGTVLLFGHRGWPTVEGPFPMINYSWGNYLTSLKQYLETGMGMPSSG